MTETISPGEVQAAATRLRAPASVARSLERLRDNDQWSPQRVASVIEGSPPLVGRVLGLAQSALYPPWSGGTPMAHRHAQAAGPRRPPAEPVLTLADAVVRVGEQQILDLVLAGEVQPLLGASIPFYDSPPARVLRHSLEVSGNAHNLTETLAAADRRKPEREASFTARMGGLLHDLGKLLIVEVLRMRSDGAAPFRLRNEPPALIEAERQRFGVHHAAVGAAVARFWGVSEPVWRAIATHHDHEPPSDPVARALWLSELTAHAGEGAPWALERVEEAYRACGLGPLHAETLLRGANPAAQLIPHPPELTRAEYAVLLIAAEGSPPRDIAQRRNSSPGTVQNQLSSAAKKLEVAGTQGAIAELRRRGWL